MGFTSGRALIVGVGKYEHVKKLNVPVVVEDAKGIRDVLCHPTYAGYEAERVKLLVDQNATLDGLRVELKKFASVKPEETVLVYYTGHGIYDTDGKYCLTTHDTRLKGDRVEPGSGLTEAELLDLLRAIPAERMLLVFNACHSGEISPALGVGQEAAALGGKTLPNGAADAILSSGKGRIIITAAGEDELSYIGTGHLTIFARAVVDGLMGKGYNNNAGFISAYGLYEYVFEAVGTAVKKLGLQQHPELTVLKGVGPFPVALYKGVAGSLGDFDAGEAPPEEAAVREVDEKRARKMFQKITNINVGGSYIAGNVNISGGDFVGRDKISYGDSYSMNVPGGISGSTVVVGKGNQVNSNGEGNAAADLDELRGLVAETGSMLANLPLDALTRMGIDVDFKMVEMLLSQTRPDMGMIAGRLNSLAAGLRAAGGVGAEALAKVEQAEKMAKKPLRQNRRYD